MERIREAVELAKISRQVAPKGSTNRHLGSDQSEIGTTGENDYAHANTIHLSRPHIEAMRIVCYDSSDPWSKSFDMLRTQVLREMDEHAWQTLAVTSPGSGCGKTVTAINLALSISREPAHSAILVDFDLRKPEIAKYFGMSQEQDLRDVLSGRANLTDVLVKPDLGNGLVVLPNQGAVSGSSEVMKSPEIKNLVRSLRGTQRSRIIIFDLPPILASDDVLAFLPQIDCVLLVAAAGSSTVFEIEESEQHLRSANLMGIVLNKSQESNNAYYP